MPNDKFLVSVIIPTYNRREGLEYTVKSLVKQDMNKSDFEIVIADDGSSDDTFEVVKRYEKLVNISYAYQPDKGYRPASARNIGIRIARGKICLFIDSGIIVKQDCLQKHVAFHAKLRKETAVIGYTYGYTQHGETEEELRSLIDPNDADLSIKRLIECGKFLDVREKIYRKYNDNLSNLTAVWTLFWGGHLSVPRQALLQIDGFDENFDGNWGCEDNDLGYRLQLENVDIAFYRDVQVLHMPHGTNLNLKKDEGLRNCTYFHSKYQTPETSLFLSYYLKEITGVEVIDFHELLAKTDVSTVA